jgi:hypothetical protein
MRNWFKQFTFTFVSIEFVKWLTRHHHCKLLIDKSMIVLYVKGMKWKVFAAFHSLLFMLCKIDEISCNFLYGLYKNLVVKFERFFELNLLVWDKFHIILSRSLMKSFALHEYRSYLVRWVKLWAQPRDIHNNDTQHN